jgi:hypothetical protein
MTTGGETTRVQMPNGGFAERLGDGLPIEYMEDMGCGTYVVPFDDHIELKMFDLMIRAKVQSDIDGSTPYSMDELDLACRDRIPDTTKGDSCLGTLGKGEHFIELAHGKDDMFLVIHSGSRYVGALVNEAYRSESGGVVSGDMLDEYLHDIEACRKWARLNRHMIAMHIFTEYLGTTAGVYDGFDTEQRYIEDGIIRVGAASAGLGERIYIPSLRDGGGAFCLGKGDDGWLRSAPADDGRDGIDGVLGESSDSVMPIERTRRLYAIRGVLY